MLLSERDISNTSIVDSSNDICSEYHIPTSDMPQMWDTWSQILKNIYFETRKHVCFNWFLFWGMVIRAVQIISFFEYFGHVQLKWFLFLRRGNKHSSNDAYFEARDHVCIILYVFLRILGTCSSNVFFGIILCSMACALASTMF